LLELGLRAWKIRLLIDPGRRMPLSRALAVNAYGDAAAAVTPGRLGGDPARFIGFGRCGIEASARLVGLGAEKIIDAFVLAALGTLLVAAFGGRGLRGALQTLSQLGVQATVVVLTLFTVFLALGVWGVLWYRRRRASHMSQPLRKLWAHARGLSAWTWTTAGILTVVGTLARVAVLPVLCFGIAPAADLGVVALGSFALLYSQLVLPTPSGAGGVELGFAVGFSSSLDPAQVATLLVAWRCYTLLVPAGLGGVLLARIVVTRRLTQAAGALLVLGAAGAVTAGAQEPLGSRNLPYDHWAYEYIEHLRPRGYLANLNPLVQPYRRLEVARGLVELDPAELPEPESHWVQMLQDELSRELARLEGSETGHWGIDLSGGARASTSKRLQVLRPTGDEDIWPWYTAGGWIEGGPFAMETRLLADRYLLHDPDGDDPGQRRFGRADNAYLSLTVPLGSFSLGRVKRNWSMLGSDGLMLSDVATAYPQLSLELKVGRLAVRSVTGELETIDGRKRYLAGHRLDYEADNLVLSFGESILYAGTTGLSLRFLNPAEFLFFDHDNAPGDLTQNLMLDGQIWYRTGKWVFHFEGMLDDVDVIPGERDPEPLLYGFTLGARVSSIKPWVDIGVTYEQVAAFAYRTPNLVDNYDFLGRGLGHNYSDYDLLTLVLDLYPAMAGLRISPVIQHQRQGEGDFRDPVPPMAEYLASPALLIGTVEKTLRLGVRGRYQPYRHFWLGWDLGENFVRNARSVEDDNVTEFTAVIEIGGTVSLPLP
jgi:uncharacterized membrane protein YbhN (UPF0104 family)